jgi:hypothetical protein
VRSQACGACRSAKRRDGSAHGREATARRMRVLAALVAACVWSSAAHAGDEGTANAFLREGADLFKHENYEGARAAFAHAYELEPRPAVLFDLALSELNGNHPVEAVAHLREYMTHTDEPPAKLLSVRTKWLPRAEARTARLEVFAPAGARVFVDGTEEGPATPGPDTTNSPIASVAVAAGDHEVSTLQGAVSEAQHITARGGEVVELHFRPPPEVPAPPPAIVWPTHADARESDGEATSRPKWVVVIAFGLGAAVAAGVGVGFGLAAQKNARDAQSTRDSLAQRSAWNDAECTGASASSRLCMQLKSDVDANRQDWTLSAVSYVGAGVLGVASLATWLWWRPKSFAVSARPAIHPRNAGLVLDGQW